MRCLCLELELQFRLLSSLNYLYFLNLALHRHIGEKDVVDTNTPSPQLHAPANNTQLDTVTIEKL